MILTIDIGNSTIKIGIIDSGNLDWVQEIPTETYNQTALLPKKQITPETAYISSVVPHIKTDFEKWLHAFFPSLQKTHWIDSTFLQNYQPQTLNCSNYQSWPLGADRLMNLYGAAHYQNSDNIVAIDFGTMTTMDLLDKSKNYLGGVIMPGPGAINKLLQTGVAEQLANYKIDILDPVEKGIGLSTEACLKSGFYYGYTGMLEKVIYELLRDSHWPQNEVTLLLTGGGSQKLESVFAKFATTHSKPYLTLFGIEQFYQNELKNH